MAQQPFDQPQWNDNGDGTVSENVNVTGAKGVLPTDIQNHLTATAVAINAVALTISTGATPNTTSSVFSCDGFQILNIISYSSVSHSGRFQIIWSTDNTNFSTYELPPNTLDASNAGTTNNRFASVKVKAPYFKILFENQDGTATPTVTVNTYLMA